MRFVILLLAGVFLCIQHHRGWGIFLLVIAFIVLLLEVA